MSRYEYDPELITTLSSSYMDAVATALAGGPLNVKQVSVLFGVSYTAAGKWAYQPRFRAYKSKSDRQAPWCFPVDAVEEVLGFKLRREHERALEHPDQDPASPEGAATVRPAEAQPDSRDTKGHR